MNSRIAWQKRFTAAVIVVVLFVSVAISLWNFRSIDQTKYDNGIRVLVSDQNSKLTPTHIQGGKYPLMVFDLKGTVRYADSVFQLEKSDVVNPNEWLSSGSQNGTQFPDYFVLTQTLEERGSVWGFSVFLIPKGEVQFMTKETVMKNVYIPLLVSLCICTLILYFQLYEDRKKILRPMGEISNSAKAIIAGNYNKEVVRTYEKKVAENEMGELIYSFELMRDELKTKQIREETLKKAQQELISCISHDLRTPISTIKAYSEGIRDGVAQTDQEKDEYVEVIIRKTDLLIQMIKELLEYSNAQLRQLSIQKEETYFLPFIQPVLKEIQTYVEQKDAVFQYQIDTRDLLMRIDQHRITEVLYNLIENSLKYKGKDVCQIHMWISHRDRYLCIRVRDNGIGIGAEDIPYVFDKFYRAEKSRNMSIPGSGLGLSICRYIVEEHGGEISCQANKEGGCQFEIRLPDYK